MGKQVAGKKGGKIEIGGERVKYLKMDQGLH